MSDSGLSKEIQNESSGVPNPSPNKLSLIVAMSENDVIGRDGDMPWHISDDLKRFKRLTMDHHIIMGRKTFESIGRCLPGRTTVIVTRQADFSVTSGKEQFHVAPDLEVAVDLASNDDESFVIGGGQIYAAALPLVSTVYLTRVHTTIDDGDTFFPSVNWAQWKMTESERFSADRRNDFDFSFENYQRIIL